jgi:hypothetical protein
MKAISNAQLSDEGTYKKPIPETDYLLVPRLLIDTTTAYIDYDGSNLTFTDGTTGTRTLAQLVAGGGGGGGDALVAVDSSAVADYLGASATTGVLRASSPLTYTDGGDYIRLGIQNAKADDSTKGAATFEADDFDDSSGKIDLADSVCKTLNTDGYSATASSHVIQLLGANQIVTAGSGNIVEIDIQSGIADTLNLIVDGSPNATEIAYFTASGLCGYTEAEFKAALNLEIGTDVLAQQTIGIADNNLLEVDGSPNAAEIAYFTASGLCGYTATELLAALSAQANATFDFNAQSLDNVNHLDVQTIGSFTSTGGIVLGENSVLLDSSLSANGKYSTAEIFAETAGANLTLGQVVYKSPTDSKWELCDADTEATISYATATVVASVSEDETVYLMDRGFLRNTGWSWSNIGAPLYADSATAGNMTVTPLGTGKYQKVVGYVWSSDTVKVNHSNDWVKVG